MEWHASSNTDDAPREMDDCTDVVARGCDIAVGLQNQTLMLLALLAAHPMPHQSLTRFRDLVDAWHQDPSEASLVRTLQARPGRFAMNVDQVVQLLIPPLDANESADEYAVHGRAGARRLPNDGHDIWRAADGHQLMHDLFLMALLATQPDPHRVSGQFRSLLPRLARSTAQSALDALTLVAVRRSVMRFDRIVQIVLSSRDAVPSGGGEAGADGHRSPRSTATAAAPAL